MIAFSKKEVELVDRRRKEEDNQNDNIYIKKMVFGRDSFW
jgi:hypothetical protein